MAADVSRPAAVRLPASATTCPRSPRNPPPLTPPPFAHTPPHPALGTVPACSRYPSGLSAKESSPAPARRFVYQVDCQIQKQYTQMQGRHSAVNPLTFTRSKYVGYTHAEYMWKTPKWFNQLGVFQPLPRARDRGSQERIDRKTIFPKSSTEREKARHGFPCQARLTRRGD